MFIAFGSQYGSAYTPLAIDLVIQGTQTTAESNFETMLEDNGHTVTVKDDSVGDNNTSETSADLIILTGSLSGESWKYPATETNAVPRLVMGAMFQLNTLQITAETGLTDNDCYDVETPSSWPTQFSDYTAFSTSTDFDWTTTVNNQRNVTMTVSSLETGREVIAYPEADTTECFGIIVADGQSGSSSGTLQCNCSVLAFLIGDYTGGSLTATADFDQFVLEVCEWTSQA